MPRPHRFHLRLLVAWLGLALLSVQVARAATDDDDSGKSKKTKKTTASPEKSDDDTSKKKKRKDADSDKDTPKSGKDSPKTAEKKSTGKDKDSGKTTAKSDKDKDKATEKSSEETPRKRRRKEPEADKEKETASSKKDSGKTASKSDKDKDSGKAEKKSDEDAPKKKKRKEPEADKDTAKSGSKASGKKSADKTEITIPISKKGSDSPAKDVTDQKADRPRDEKAMRDGEGGEFDNEGKSKENAPKKVEEKAGERRDLGRAASSSSSRDMAGWEVVHYQDRDWVTSNSIFRFYRFADHHIEGNVVWFTSPVLIMKAVLGSQELLINNIKFILSNPVEEVNGKVLFSRLDLCKLIDPVLRPSYIGHGQVFDTVIVDAGHGGYDSGARGIYGYEKNFALQLAGLLKADLEKRGLKVVLTRSDDTFISLGGRVEFANKVPNSIFVSLHFNSGQSAATGIETYALSPQGASSDYGARSVDAMAFNGNQRDSENIALATAIHASVVHHFKLVDRGVKRARWYVLTGLERPGVLFEGGFVTNNSDGQLIAADNFRRELAHTIGDAISNYRRALSH